MYLKKIHCRDDDLKVIYFWSRDMSRDQNSGEKNPVLYSRKISSSSRWSNRRYLGSFKTLHAQALNFLRINSAISPAFTVG